MYNMIDIFLFEIYVVRRIKIIYFKLCHGEDHILYENIVIYLESFYQELIKKRSQSIKFVICRKSREVMVCN